MKIKLINNRGQTLLEALIALAIIVVIMSGTTVAVVSSLNNASFVKSQNQVNKIAQQGMEYIRDQIANNSQFVTYTTSSPSYGNSLRCLGPNYDMAVVVSNPATPQNFCYGPRMIDGKYLRTVAFSTSRCTSATADFTDGVKATVTVYWTDNKCPTGSNNNYCHSQEITSCFINPSKTVVPTTAQGI